MGKNFQKKPIEFFFFGFCSLIGRNYKNLDSLIFREIIYAQPWMDKNGLLKKKSKSIIESTCHSRPKSIWSITKKKIFLNLNFCSFFAIDH